MAHSAELVPIKARFPRSWSATWCLSAVAQRSPDAEDAFQAVFLVLVCRTISSATGCTGVAANGHARCESRLQAFSTERQVVS